MTHTEKDDLVERLEHFGRDFRNSVITQTCREAATRIEALERELAEAREAALEEAAQCVEKMQTNNVGMVHPIAAAEAAAIRALKTGKSPPPLSE